VQPVPFELHAAQRSKPTRRAFSHLSDDHERTITVFGKRLVPHGDDDLPWARLHGAAEAALGESPATFHLADRYEGAPLPDGSASLTLRVRIAPLDRTWTQEEIDALMNRLSEAMTRETGAARRA